jgi:hypothetical protein
MWNKTLYCDLMHQTLSAGIMTDYDATAAFDWVLHAMSIITCRWLGMPHQACMFMYHLLQNMEFFLLTGFGVSTTSFHNKDDPMQPGQGMLQGSSSAAPIYNICTDISLTTYTKLAHGAIFKHPISGVSISDCATQYVNDKTEMINTMGINAPLNDCHSQESESKWIFLAANENTHVWTTLLWLSGGNLNPSKCIKNFCVKPMQWCLCISNCCQICLYQT